MLRRIFILAMWGAWLGLTLYFGWEGLDYYGLDLSSRPASAEHDRLRPSGYVGHGLGITGTMMMIVGVLMYAIRKRARRFATWGNLRDWLAFHIFLCVTGATLVTYHTAFKFGGLVSISYWSMVGVVVSGVLGRYVYVRIPRDIQGNASAASEIERESEEIAKQLRGQYALSETATRALDSIVLSEREGNGGLGRMIVSDLKRLSVGRRVRRVLRQDGMCPSDVSKRIAYLVRRRASLIRSVRFYTLARNVLHYWHVVHLPFTVVMFLIMFVHVAVAILFGSTWIF
jgi:hypothetical protein